MARQLHLFKGDHADTAAAVIAPQVSAGDDVTVAVLGGATPPALSPAAAIRRVPDELSYDGLVALIFEADAVVTW
jgi:hypothetical protein